MARILIVEDSPTQAAQLRIILESEGFEIDAAASGEVALQRFTAMPFDMVISDIMMPGISGYDLCRRIKQDPRGRETPVVLLSTLSDPMDIIRGLECGADNFMTKPYEPDQLIARIRTVLNTKEARSRGKLSFGVEVVFLGRKILVNSEKEQILDLLIATFEDIVRTNRGLQQSQAELSAAKEEIERRAAELESRVLERTAELFERQRQLAQAQAIAHVGNWRISVPSNKVEWSDEMYWIYGVERDKPVRTLDGMMSLAHPDDRDRLNGLMQQAIADRSSYRDEYRIVQPNGDERFCWIECHCQLGEQGKVHALFGVCQDVTERKTAETRLQVLQAELLHVSRLGAMGQMGSTLAHELNQPLAAVSNYVQAARRMLEMGDEAVRQKVPDILTQAARQAARAGEVVQRLRDFVSKGKTEQRPEVLSEVVEEANALVLAGMARHDVRVRFDFDPGVRLAVIDRVQIQQVLVNLMRNAIEAMAESDRRELTISTAAREDGVAEIRVADTGPGLAPEVVEQLFKPFITTKTHGMGVGLSICQSIVAAHRGKIQAEPNLGGGTIFRFTVPVAAEDASIVSETAADH